MVNMVTAKELHELLKQVDTLKGKVDQFGPLSEREVAALEHDKRIEHVWSSNAIEGSKLTKFETVSILDNGVTVHGASVKDTLAAIDLNDAYDYMMSLAADKQPLTETIVRDLNRISTMGESTAGDKQVTPGVYRTGEAWPDKLEESPYTAPFDIGPQMSDLIKWSQGAQNSEHPVVYAADLHRRFVSIHPFFDGNGRTARLLMNFALTENGFPVINVEPDAKSRTEYMDRLHLARTTGNEEPFRLLVAGYVKKELGDRIKVLELSEQNHKDAEREVSPELKKILNQHHDNQNHEKGLDR